MWRTEKRGGGRGEALTCGAFNFGVSCSDIA